MKYSLYNFFVNVLIFCDLLKIKFYIAFYKIIAYVKRT